MVTRDPVEALRVELRAYPQILAEIESKPDLMHLLGALVGLYSPGGQWWTMRRHQAPPAKRTRRKALALVRAVARVQHLVEDPLLVNAFGSLAIANGKLAHLQATLAATRERAERLAAKPRHRGRRADAGRRLFCGGIAQLLRGAGVSLTSGRDGVYGRVLASAFVAAGEDPPDDLFPLMKLAARAA